MNWGTDQYYRGTWSWPASFEATMIAFAPMIKDLVTWLYDKAVKYKDCTTELASFIATNTGATVEISNGGGCSTTAIRQTIYDGVKDIVHYFQHNNITKGCTSFDHEGVWEGTLKISSM